ncbi:MAG: YfcE family phosphodiesterase [Clostridia bacterium]|nr:YfcE family phosphodiesterase [Clostridia bacterium]
MRILVLSDSHKHTANLFDAIKNEPSAEIVYFLGDGIQEAEDAVSVFKGKKFFVLLRGNCDFSVSVPLCDVRSIENAKIYASHGAEENVKLSYAGIKREARRNTCNIVLFGHTHEKYYNYEDGLHIFNPGSIKDGSYGIIDIEENGIMCFHKRLY